MTAGKKCSPSWRCVTLPPRPASQLSGKWCSTHAGRRSPASCCSTCQTRRGGGSRGHLVPAAAAPRRDPGRVPPLQQPINSSELSHTHQAVTAVDWKCTKRSPERAGVDEVRSALCRPSLHLVLLHVRRSGRQDVRAFTVKFISAPSIPACLPPGKMFDHRRGRRKSRVRPNGSLRYTYRGTTKRCF